MEVSYLPCLTGGREDSEDCGVPLNPPNVHVEPSIELVTAMLRYDGSVNAERRGFARNGNRGAGGMNEVVACASDS